MTIPIVIMYSTYNYVYLVSLIENQTPRGVSMIAKEVKKTMIDQELTITRLAGITGYTRAHLCNVINGHFESVRAKKSIALALGKDFNSLWGAQDTSNNTSV